MYNVFTTFSIKHYHLYGKNFIDSFIKFWPKDVNLYIYYDSHPPEEFINIDNRLHWLNYEEQCPNQKYFADRNKHKTQEPWYMSATRFSYKAYSIITHLNKNITKYSIWLDADTITTKLLPYEWLSSLVADNCYISALLRRSINCMESGFMIFDTTNVAHKEFVAIYTKMYDEDLLFSLDQWHDAYITTAVISYMEKHKKIKVNDLSPKDEITHPFVKGVLGEYMDHMKGNRKLQGFSQERLNSWS